MKFAPAYSIRFMRTFGFHHLAIQVHDVERSAAFYRDVVGLMELVRHHQPDGSLRSIWLSLGGAEGQAFIALEQTSAEAQPTPFRHAYTGHHLLALRIDRDSRQGLVARLREEGVTIEHETRWTFYVRDPEGNRIGFSHHPVDPLSGTGLKILHICG